MAHDLVVFGEDWGAHPSSTQHLVKQFLDERNVVWVNSLGMRTPNLSWRDGKRVLNKLGDLAKRSLAPAPPSDETEGQPPAIIAPAALPFPGNAFAAGITRAMVSKQIKSAMSQLGMKRPVLWTSLPTALPMVGALNERAVVYYCGDDFGALHGVEHKPVLEMEKKLAQKADLILAASPQIAERFPTSRTLVVPHGVDLDLFSTPRARPKDLPPGQPIIGFYGNISGWIDTQMLDLAAQRLPDMRFVFIGPVTTDIRLLSRHENVQFLGAKPHHMLPAYVQHFDVAMLPFRDNPQIRACNPLKLREYLAAGTPVASTEFPALEPYRSLLHIGREPLEFISALKAALKDQDRAKLRRRAVASETWTRRAEDISNLIDLL